MFAKFVFAFILLLFIFCCILCILTFYVLCLGDVSLDASAGAALVCPSDVRMLAQALLRGGQTQVCLQDRLRHGPAELHCGLLHGAARLFRQLPRVLSARADCAHLHRRGQGPHECEYRFINHLQISILTGLTMAALKSNVRTDINYPKKS